MGLSIRVTLLAALVAALVAVAPARAQDVTGHPVAGELNWMAYNWWAYYHGRFGCHPAHLRVYLHDHAASDWGCQVWLSRSLWNAAGSGPMDGYRVAMRHDLCSQMVHERGHSAGLGHASGWVMDPYVLWPVAMCQRWARG